LIMGVALPFINYLVDKNWSYIWDNPQNKIAYEKRMLINLRRDRNHPSVVMWVTSGNFFGHSQDQNPLNIGMTNWVTNNTNFQRNAKAGTEAIDIIKKHDPTRPVITHHGTYVGDVHTLNFYLDLIPLQEREEWMSYYANHGQLPFIGIEFGTPLFCTFLRGRNGFGNNIKSEPLVTEFAAMYLGNDAYTKEPQNYRSLLRNNFISEQTYKPMDNPPILLENMWSFQQIQALFTKNTWRSWRTYGIPGGLLPWTNGHGWSRTDSANVLVKMKPFESGRRGMYYPTVKLGDLKDFQEPAYKVHAAGKAFIENNNETLAYIAGPSSVFTAKDHNFKTGEMVEKRIFFFNDTRAIQDCNWSYEVKIQNKLIASGKGKELIPIGDKKSAVLYFTTPQEITNAKADGEIILSANIGKNLHADTFKFRVFKREAIKGNKDVYVYDPVGKTSAMLTALGYQVKIWNGELNQPLILIGREVLSKNYKLPFSLEDYIQKGGKVVVFNQQDSVLEKSGFRLSKFVSRYVFPIENNKITGLLDKLDLRNWRGEGTLVNPYPDYIHSAYERAPDNTPIYGWHWGNRGSVATHAIEKPHNSGWTPLLECEFDMAYSPLLELNYGNGKLIWCSLDLEDHAEVDPAAEILTKQLLNYAQNTNPKPRNKNTLFIGIDNEKQQLDQLGLIYKVAQKVEANAELIICGTLNTYQQKQIEKYVQNGGKIIILPRTKEETYFGVNYTQDENFEGGKTIP
ncbi:MAG TPA: glycoside hydrolase family 2 TIM barrel-domain containing protein, partial [Arachidicoccus soli]|nr:glycoside hydrolase family 2 TIM barrel-domain containing protein [Arachidicoccus soli]